MWVTKRKKKGVLFILCSILIIVILCAISKYDKKEYSFIPSVTFQVEKIAKPLIELLTLNLTFTKNGKKEKIKYYVETCRKFNKFENLIYINYKSPLVNLFLNEYMYKPKNIKLLLSAMITRKEDVLIILTSHFSTKNTKSLLQVIDDLKKTNVYYIYIADMAASLIIITDDYFTVEKNDKIFPVQSFAKNSIMRRFHSFCLSKPKDKSCNYFEWYNKEAEPVVNYVRGSMGLYAAKKFEENTETIVFVILEKEMNFDVDKIFFVNTIFSGQQVCYLQPSKLNKKWINGNIRECLEVNWNRNKTKNFDHRKTLIKDKYAVLLDGSLLLSPLLPLYFNKTKHLLRSSKELIAITSFNSFNNNKYSSDILRLCSSIDKLAILMELNVFLDLTSSLSKLDTLNIISRLNKYAHDNELYFIYPGISKVWNPDETIPKSSGLQMFNKGDFKKFGFEYVKTQELYMSFLNSILRKSKFIAEPRLEKYLIEKMTPKLPVKVRATKKYEVICVSRTYFLENWPRVIRKIKLGNSHEGALYKNDILQMEINNVTVTVLLMPNKNFKHDCPNNIKN